MSSLELKPAGPKQMSGVFRQSSRRLPYFHRFHQVHHLSPVSISPSESGNRQQLVSIKLKQLFDEHQLQYFSGDKRNRARAEMTGSHQISRQRLCRFQDDDRNNQERERRIRPQRDDPEPRSLEKIAFSDPYTYRPRRVR